MWAKISELEVFPFFCRYEGRREGGKEGRREGSKEGKGTKGTKGTKGV